ncbi:lipoate--protein ligase family protein [Nakamurella sp. YIM 132087]|uniref:Lipoate--protein ligase family protein n=1 Tax=Nakamurella alba TaxID=2665158 RepID=A0A7K1FSI6_9ACTN|nr:lipoate--protein ligase family protein [Nakamurella alba]MTD16359.1 lipoate--protein ligase family protein [Nakamurella alba]
MPDRLVVLDHPQVLDPMIDIAVGPAMLAAARSSGTALLRISRPAPTVALSGRDCNSPGKDLAVAAALAHGFTPVRRGPGGRAVAYHTGCLCLDLVEPAPEFGGIAERFDRLTGVLLAALTAVGVDGGIGETPGEYCAGDHSIHDGMGHKLAGTAQRLVPGAALFSAVIVVDDPLPVRDVLVDVYAALGLDWDPATVGAARSVSAAADPDGLTRALVHAFAGGASIEVRELPESVLADAAARRDRHRV